MQSRAVVPVIRDLNEGANQISVSELERARKMLAKGEDPEAVLEQFARSLTQKFLHAPMVALNRSQGAEREQLLSCLPKLFPVQKNEH